MEVDIVKNKPNIIMECHYDGETWGMDLIEDKGMFVTSGDDGKVIMYDIQKK